MIRLPLAFLEKQHMQKFRQIIFLAGSVLLTVILTTGCASTPAPRYKAETEGPSISISDNGLSLWKDINTATGQIGGTMRVLSFKKDKTGYFSPQTLEEKHIMEARFLAGQRMRGAVMPLAPIAFDALKQEASWLSPSVKISMDETLKESANIQIIPTTLFILLGEGVVAFESEWISRFVDTNGERQKRTYRYISRFELPWIDAEPSWSSNNYALLKSQINSSFRAISKVLLRDAKGAFVEEMNTRTPKIVGKESGLVTISTVQLAEFDQLRVLYETVNFPAYMPHLIILDDAPPSVIFRQ